MAFEHIRFNMTLSNGIELEFLKDTEGFVAIQATVPGAPGPVQIPISAVEANKLIALATSVMEAYNIQAD